MNDDVQTAIARRPSKSQYGANSPVPSTRTDLKLTAPGGGPIFIGPQPLLPTDKVRHVGEAVAMVVGETLAQARDAAEAVEVTYAIERLIDEAARRFGFDRIALRRRNLVPPERMPYENAVGAAYDSGTYEGNMDLAMRLADWDGFAARRRAASARGRLLGLELANYVESSIGAPRERTEWTVTEDGPIRVVIGTQPSGQGHETSFAQVVSALLEVPVDTVDIVMGDAARSDTDPRLPDAPGCRELSQPRRQPGRSRRPFCPFARLLDGEHNNSGNGMHVEARPRGVKQRIRKACRAAAVQPLHSGANCVATICS